MKNPLAHRRINSEQVQTKQSISEEILGYQPCINEEPFEQSIYEGSHKVQVSVLDPDLQKELLAFDDQLAQLIEKTKSENIEDQIGTLLSQFLFVARESFGPVVSTFVYMIVQVVNQLYIGHTGDINLIAGIGVGNMLINVLAFAFLQGLNGALETIISASFGASRALGHDNSPEALSFRKNCGAFYNRGRFVASCAMIPISILFCCSSRILQATHQDSTVSEIAQSYVVMMIPGVWAMGQFDATKKFLSSQQRNSVPVYIQIATTLVHIMSCELLIKHWDMRETGTAIATNITYFSNMLIMDVLLRLDKKSEIKDMIFFYDSSVLKRKQIGLYLKIGVPGMLMLCFEWWAMEFLAIFSGLISVRDLAAQVVTIQFVALIFMLPLGISFSSSALVGSYLGEQKIKLAKRFAMFTIALDVLVTTLIVLLVYFCPRQIFQILTNEPDVIDTIEDLSWVLVIYIFFDTIHGVQSGIIRGLGLQSYGSFYTLVCYYIIGMPLALCLSFTMNLKVKGLWLGYSIACIILDLGFAAIISCPSWEKIAIKMRQSMEDEAIQQSPEMFFKNEILTPQEKRFAIRNNKTGLLIADQKAKQLEKDTQILNSIKDSQSSNRGLF